jgi:hypothetical protein
MDEVNFQILINQLFLNMLKYNLIFPDYLYTSSPVRSRTNKICLIVIKKITTCWFFFVFGIVFLIFEYASSTRILQGSFAIYLQ